METFHQILDLDEDDTHEFSRGMAWAYFSQVDNTFVEMDEALCVFTHVKLTTDSHVLFSERTRISPSFPHSDTFSKDLRRLLACRKSKRHVNEFNIMGNYEMKMWDRI
jgi:hypothetical protein